jgi:hypothetical protein
METATMAISAVLAISLKFIGVFCFSVSSREETPLLKIRIAIKGSSYWTQQVSGQKNFQQQIDRVRLMRLEQNIADVKAHRVNADAHPVSNLLAGKSLT